MYAILSILWFMAKQNSLCKADCGCVYHAEEGIPCEHDIETLGNPLIETEGC